MLVKTNYFYLTRELETVSNYVRILSEEKQEKNECKILMMVLNLNGGLYSYDYNMLKKFNEQIAEWGGSTFSAVYCLLLCHTNFNVLYVLKEPMLTWSKRMCWLVNAKAEYRWVIKLATSLPKLDQPFVYEIAKDGEALFLKKIYPDVGSNIIFGNEGYRTILV